MKALGCYIFIEKNKSENKSNAGIILPNDRQASGPIRSLDPEYYFTESRIKVGDVAYFNWRNAVEVKVDGEVFIVVKDEDVYCTTEAK